MIAVRAVTNSQLGGGQPGLQHPQAGRPHDVIDGAAVDQHRLGHLVQLDWVSRHNAGSEAAARTGTRV